MNSESVDLWGVKVTATFLKLSQPQRVWIHSSHVWLKEPRVEVVTTYSMLRHNHRAALGARTGRQVIVRVFKDRMVTCQGTAASELVSRTGELTPDLVRKFQEDGYLAIPGLCCLGPMPKLRG